MRCVSKAGEGFTEGCTSDGIFRVVPGKGGNNFNNNIGFSEYRCSSTRSGTKCGYCLFGQVWGSYGEGMAFETREYNADSALATEG